MAYRDVLEACRALDRMKPHPDFPRPMSVRFEADEPAPAGYFAKQKLAGIGQRHWVRPLCAACAIGPADADFTYADHYLPNPEPASESDLYGWSEGKAVWCDCCSAELTK